MSIRRLCPECGEAVPAGIVRHPKCFHQALADTWARTEREWNERTWGKHDAEAAERKGVVKMPVEKAV